jgi:hypothetical protein
MSYRQNLGLRSTSAFERWGCFPSICILYIFILLNESNVRYTNNFGNKEFHHFHIHLSVLYFFFLLGHFIPLQVLRPPLSSCEERGFLAFKRHASRAGWRMFLYNYRMLPRIFVAPYFPYNRGWVNS